MFQDTLKFYTFVKENVESGDVRIYMSWHHGLVLTISAYNIKNGEFEFVREVFSEKMVATFKGDFDHIVEDLCEKLNRILRG